jgi:hypothetical protein
MTKRSDLDRLTARYGRHATNLRVGRSNPGRDRRGLAQVEGALLDAGHRTLVGLLVERAALLARLDRKFTRDERPELFARLDLAHDRIGEILRAA